MSPSFVVLVVVAAHLFVSHRCVATTFDISTANSNVLVVSGGSYPTGASLTGWSGSSTVIEAIVLEHLETTTITVQGGSNFIVVLNNVTCQGISFASLSNCNINLTNSFVIGTNAGDGFQVNGNVQSNTVINITNTMINWFGVTGDAGVVGFSGSFDSSSLNLNSVNITGTSTAFAIYAVLFQGLVSSLQALSITSCNISINCAANCQALGLIAGVDGGGVALISDSHIGVTPSSSATILGLHNSANYVVFVIQNSVLSSQIVANFQLVTESNFTMSNVICLQGGQVICTHVSSSSAFSFTNVQMSLLGVTGPLTMFDFSQNSWDGGYLYLDKVAATVSVSGAQALVFFKLTTVTAPAISVTNSNFTLIGSDVRWLDVTTALQNSGTISVIGNSIAITGTGAGVAITLGHLDTVSYVYIDSNVVTITAGSVAGALSTGYVQSGNRLQMRHNTFGLTALTGTAYVWSASNYVTSTTAVIFERNWVNCYGSTGAQAFNLGGYVSSALLSIGFNDMIISTSAGPAMMLDVSQYLTITLVIVNNTVDVSGTPTASSAYLSIGQYIEGTTLAFANNFFNGSAQVVSSPITLDNPASSGYTGCNFGNNSQLLGPLPTTGSGSFPVLNYGCGMCATNIQCNGAVALAYLAPIDGMCACKCIATGSTTFAYVPYEDQCTAFDTTEAPSSTSIPTTPSPTTTGAPTSTTAATTTTTTTTTTLPTTTTTGFPLSTALLTTSSPTTTAAVTDTATTPPSTTPAPPQNASGSSADASTAPTAPAAQTQAVAAGGAIAAGTALASAGALTPGWCAHASRDAILQTLIDCPQPFNPDDKLDPIESPSGVAVGDSNTKYYLGAIVVNGSFVLGMIVIQLLIGIGFHLFRKPSTEPQARPHSWKRSLLVAKLPRANYIWFMLFLQPFLHCGLVMTALADGDWTNFVIGIVTFVVAQGLATYFAFQITGSRMVATYVVEEESEKWSWMRSMWFPKGEWQPGPSEDAQLHHKLFKPLYAPFKPGGSCFALSDMTAALAMAVIATINPTTNAQCLYQATAILVVCAVYLLAVLIVRPFAAPADTACLAILATIEFVDAIFFTIYMSDQINNHWAKDVTTTISDIDLYFTFALVTKDLILAAVHQYLKHVDAAAEATHSAGVEEEKELYLEAQHVITSPSDDNNTLVDDGGEPANPILAYSAFTLSARDRVVQAIAQPDEEWVFIDEESLWYCSRYRVYMDASGAHYYDCQTELWMDQHGNELEENEIADAAALVDVPDVAFADDDDDADQGDEGGLLNDGTPSSEW